MVLREIENRRSIRNYLEETPSDEVILNALESARLAPSWMNAQPWRFIVIKDKSTKELLFRLSCNQPHVLQAPVIIACCGDLSVWEAENFKKHLESKPGMTQERINALLNNPIFNPGLKGKDMAMLRTVEELTYAIAYITLEAERQNAGVCVIGAIGNELTGGLPEVYAEVRKKLNLPDHIILVSLLTFGYPDLSVKKPAKIRKPASEIIFNEKMQK